MHWHKKNSYKGNVNGKKNSCGSKIPPPLPPTRLLHNCPFLMFKERSTETMSICNYLVQRSEQIKRYHDWTDLLLVTLFLRTIADCSTADFLFFVLPFLFTVLPSFFPSAVFTNSAQRLWTVFPKCRDWRSMSPCITSSLFSGCSNLEDRASYWKLWLRQAQQSVPRSCFLACHTTFPTLRDIPKNGCGGD